MRLKRKKERKKNGKTNCKEGRGKKPKIQACLNSQLLVKKTKQNKTKQSKTSKKSYMFNNESPLIKTCTTTLF